MERKLRHAPDFFRDPTVLATIGEVDYLDPRNGDPSDEYYYSRAFEWQQYDDEYNIALESLAEALFDNSSKQNIGNIPSGYTYFGQFIAHDLTAMHVDDERKVVRNLRNPKLDLESVYGPLKAKPNLINEYSESKHKSLGYIENDTKCPFDLPRENGGEAWIADSRADDLLPLAQYNVLFLKLYNLVAEKLKTKGVSDNSLDDAVRLECKFIYQEIIWKDYLNIILDNTVLKDVIGGKRIAIPDSSVVKGVFRLPIEFAAAAFRFGHAMVRDSYPEWNGHPLSDPGGPEIFFELTNASSSTPIRFLPKRWATNWAQLFEFSDILDFSAIGGPLYAASIGPRISSGLADITLKAFPGEKGPRNLAHRTLKRIKELSLPSAQKVVTKINLELENAEKAKYNVIDIEKKGKPIFDKMSITDGKKIIENTPLWLYILIESAQRKPHDNKLGKIGSRIIAETIYLAIAASSPNIFTNSADWQPVIERRNKVHLQLTDLIIATGDIFPS